jgi:hypothetical protein
MLFTSRPNCNVFAYVLSRRTMQISQSWPLLTVHFSLDAMYEMRYNAGSIEKSLLKISLKEDSRTTHE